MNNSEFFALNIKDFAKGLVLAVFTAVLLPLSLAIQSPGFSFATANWHVICGLALNAGIVAFVSYLAKNLLSTPDGKFLGKVG